MVVIIFCDNWWMASPLRYITLTQHRAVITLMSSSFAACLMTKAHTSCICAALPLCPAPTCRSGESLAEMSGPAAQAAPPAFVLWYQGTQAPVWSSDYTLCVRAVNHRPFAVHSLVINMLIYVITGSEFLRSTCRVVKLFGSKFPF